MFLLLKGRSFLTTAVAPCVTEFFRSNPRFVPHRTEKLEYIERRDPAGLNAFLSSTSHTVSGRHLLAVWMYATSSSSTSAVADPVTADAVANLRARFCHYRQCKLLAQHRTRKSNDPQTTFPCIITWAAAIVTDGDPGEAPHRR